MAKRSIDMLPLLDVFMVVLFVFATIQEQQLDSSAHELDERSEALAAAAAQAEQGAARVEALERELERERERSRHRAEAAQAHSERLDEYERVCGPQRDGLLCPPAQLDPDARAQAAMAALHERLLDNVAVFEVELEGSPDLTTGALYNRCCYRADPPTGEWRSCGEVPSDAQARSSWLAKGGDGLLAGLSRTHGGKAVVVLRQGTQARVDLSRDLGRDLAEQLRERVPDLRIYEDGTRAGPPECPRLQARPGP